MEALRPVPWRAVWDDKRDTEVAWAESAVFRGGVRRVKLDRWISLRLCSGGPSHAMGLLAVLSPHPGSHVAFALHDFSPFLHACIT